MPYHGEIMELIFLDDILIISGLAIAASFVCLRLKLPTIVGFLVAGALAGPHGFGFIGDVEEVEHMADIGVIFLLFTIGLEFSMARLFSIKRAALLGGSVQVGLTLLATAVVAHAFEFTWAQSVFMGFLFALSSTAVVLKLLQERSALDTPHGRTALGILIFQDIIIVPMMIVTPILGGEGGPLGRELTLIAGKALLLLAFIYLSAKWIIPLVLYRITGTRSRDLFLLVVIFIAFALAWTTSWLGMSLALGAFLAGLMIAESEYHVQAASNILPFREIFMSFFFVAVGMLLDIHAVLDHAWIVLLLTASLILFKFIFAGLATLVIGYPLRTVLLVGLTLGQVGEFSFILAEVGRGYGLLPGDSHAVFIAVTVLTILVTPFMMGLEKRANALAERFPWKGFLAMDGGLKIEPMQNHVVIVGFGLVGRQIARVAKASAIPYRVIELNPDTVRRERKAGEPILYGDATYAEVLHSAGVDRAKLLVVTAPDTAVAGRLTHLARGLNAEIRIIFRARFFTEIETLNRIGVDEVVPDELEASIEIYRRVLMHYEVPAGRVQDLCRELREGGYRRLRECGEGDEESADRPA
jgi:CPA2 family monovalent cation:H+ antiporter-2